MEKVPQFRRYRTDIFFQNLTPHWRKNPNYSHDIPAHLDAAAYQICLQTVQQFLQLHLPRSVADKFQ